MNFKHVVVIVFVNVIFTLCLFRLQVAELRKSVLGQPESLVALPELGRDADTETVKALQAEIDRLTRQVAASAAQQQQVQQSPAQCPAQQCPPPAPPTHCPPPAAAASSMVADNERRQRTIERVTQHVQRMQTAIHDYANAKYLVFGESGSGVGNRFNALITTMLLAIASKRVFLLQGTDFNSEFANELQPTFEWLIPNFDRKFTPEQRQSHVLLRFECCNGSNKTLIDSLADRPHFMNLDMSEGTIFSQIACHDWVSMYSDRKFISFRTNQYLANMAMNNPYYSCEMNALFDGFDPFSILAKSMLILRPELQVFVDRFKAKHKFAEHFMVGVQLRFELMRVSENRVMGKASKFFECARDINGDRLRQTADTRPLKIFQCSDDKVKMNALKQQNPDLAIVELEPDDMLPFPNFTMVNRGLGSRELYRLLDIWMLGECNDLVLTDLSTFGPVASAKSGLKPAVLLMEGLCMRRLRSEPCNIYSWALPHQSCYKNVTQYQQDWALCQTDYFRADPWERKS